MPAPTFLHPRRSRLARVLHYIDAHLDEPLRAQRLSAVAALSRHHFHRRFSRMLGVGLGRYVTLRRLRRAAWQLAFRDGLSVADIALACGYEAPESFARAFRRSLGQTPTDFRRRPRWRELHALYQPLSDMRSLHMAPAASEVSIVDVPATRVAVFEHRGDPRLVGETVRRFIAWRKRHHLPPRTHATFNIAYDDPARTPPDAFRLDLCVATELDVDGDPDGAVAKTIPGGRCAVLRHHGSDDLLGETVRRLVQDWLPTSGESRRDAPLVFRRLAFFPDVPEHEAVVDVYLPLA